jgi:hypothetical protein
MARHITGLDPESIAAVYPVIDSEDIAIQAPDIRNRTIAVNL